MSSTGQKDPVTLVTLLPSPFILAYAVPLLVMSIPVTFAGAFLTLDRTRSFKPSDSRSSGAFRLEGGIGGLAAGFVFGVHFTTLLSLVIMNKTSASVISGVYFLVIWLLPSFPLSLLSGRFKIAALIFIGLNGGAALGILLAIIFTPILLARLIIVLVFSCILPILCLIPNPALQHSALRTSAGFMGSFGITLAGALLAGATSWSDPWSRLWLASDPSWGSGQEKGMSAAMAVMAVIGIASDYLLKRKFGENPDQKWDAYLASYAANLPNQADRAGTFQPEVPWWKRMFNPPPAEPVAYPPSSPRDRAGLKLKSRKSSTGGFAPGVKFQPLSKGDEFSSDSSSESDDDQRIPRPWSNGKAKRSGTSLSGTTAHSGESAGKKADKATDDYSDGEAAIARHKSQRRQSRDAPGWTPGFMQRAKSNVASPEKDLEQGLELAAKDATSASPSPPAPRGAVPVTPSLIHAVNRVAKAQAEAAGTPPASSPRPRSPLTPLSDEPSSPPPGWQGFWSTVAQVAAANPRPPPDDGKK